MTRMVMSGGLHRRRSLFLWGVVGCRGVQKTDVKGLMSDCSAENDLN